MSTACLVHEPAADDLPLDRTLTGLRPEEREVLFLSAVEGYTAREIGLLTKRPRGTVLSLLFRAKARLRTMLAEPDSGTVSNAAGGTTDGVASGATNGMASGTTEAKGDRREEER